MPHLALTNEQLGLVIAAANSVPPSWRSRFFVAVEDNLMTLDEITDADVAIAIDTARGAIVGAPHDAAGDDGHPVSD